MTRKSNTMYFNDILEGSTELNKCKMYKGSYTLEDTALKSQLQEKEANEYYDICVEQCVAVTLIFQGETLIDKLSTVTQSSCLSKRQEAKPTKSEVGAPNSYCI